MRRILLLAFSTLFFVSQAQERGQNTLTQEQIDQMTWVEAMQDYRVNFHTVVDKFEDYWGDRAYEKGQGFKQFKRWEDFMGERVGEDGKRPQPSVLYQAIQAQKSSTEYGNWSPVGPFDAPSGGGIGRINCVAMHPTHHDTIYAGAPAGGLWVSYDDGQNWTTHTDELTNIGVSDLAIDPNHPDTMYLATGDRDAADTYSFGLMKSTDGGVTWAATGLSFNVNQNYRIGRVIVHPDSSAIVVAVTNGGIYRSTNYGQTFTGEQSGAFFGVRHGTGGTMYATTSGSNPSIWKSTDYGDNWSKLTSGLPTTGKYRVEVAVAESSPSTLYAVFGDSNYGFGGLYKSTNSGSSWTLQSSTPNIMGWSVNGTGSGGQAWYDMSIAVDPNDANKVYVGGVNIWRSTNGGTNWTCVGHWYGANPAPYVHADHHHAKFRPGTSELYIGTDGGVYKSADGGSNWTHLNDGMNITQYYKISQSTSDTMVVLGGAQDNGSHLRTTTSNWNEVTGGDGMDNGVDAVNDDIMYTSIYYGDFYKSTNGGASFSGINTLSPSGNGNWVTPFNTDPVAANTIYAGFDRLWKSTNGGTSWAATSTSAITGSNIDEFEVAAANTNYIYVLINQAIFKSTNGGSSWTAVTPSGSLAPGNNISGVAIDPTDEEHLVISISGYNPTKKVYESYDAGSTWSNISSGLPNVPATCVIFEGGANNGIYVGTDIGVYYKSATYTSWVSFNKNLPNVIISDFEMFEDEDLLRIGTFGRGVWQSPTMASFNTAPEANFTADPANSCSVTDTVLLYDASGGLPTSWYWEITPSTYTFVGGTNDSSTNPQVVFSSTGAYTVKLSVSNTYGSSDTTKFQFINVGGRSLPFVEDFESGLAAWSIENSDGGSTWESATTGGTSPGSTAMYLDHYNYSAVGEKDALISEALDFSNDTLVELTFEYAYRAYSSTYTDSLNVYVSSDCGQSWTRVAAYGEGGSSNWATGSNVSTSWTPSTASDWCVSSTLASCPTIDLNAYSGMSGIRVKFEAVNGYGNGMYLDNINIQGQAQVAPTAFFAGDTAGCTANAVAFMDYSTPAPTSRTWYFPGGTPATSTAANPSVSYALSGTYDVALVVTNAAGTDSTYHSNYISISPAQIATVALSPSTTNVCEGDTIGFTSTYVNGGVSPVVEWYVNGQKRATSASYSDVFSHGDVVVVKLISSDDCVLNQVAYDTLVMSVNVLPTVSLGAQGYVCELDGLQALSGGLPAGGTYSGNGVSGGAIDPQAAGTGSHWIYYTYTDPSTGCANTAKRAISVQPAPAKPSAAQNATTGELEATTGLGNFTYQWLDGNMDPISGATAQTYMPTANGDYYVKIFSNILCSNTSDAVSVNNIGLEELPEEGFALYPNPATSTLMVHTLGQAEVRIFSAAGQLVFANTLEGQTSIDVSQWARGAYMIQINMGDKSVTKPLMLQ